MRSLIRQHRSKNGPKYAVDTKLHTSSNYSELEEGPAGILATMVLILATGAFLMIARSFGLSFFLSLTVLVRRFHFSLTFLLSSFPPLTILAKVIRLGERSSALGRDVDRSLPYITRSLVTHCIFIIMRGMSLALRLHAVFPRKFCTALSGPRNGRTTGAISPR